MMAWLAWGIPLITWLQSLGDWLTAPMLLFSFFGGEEFYLLIMPALFWCYDARLGFRIGVILLASTSVNAILKMLVGWPRPTWVSTEVRAMSSESSFGFPSGHAQNAFAIWGRLSSEIGKRSATLLFGLLILLISISRLQLGVHFPMDILGGWLAGAGLLWIAFRIEEPVRRRFSSGRLPILVGLAFLICLMIIFTGWGASRISRAVPEAWAQAAALADPESAPIDPLNLRGLIASAGALFGLIAGWICLSKWGGFNSGGAIWRRFLRYLLGLAGIVILFYGLRSLSPPHNPALQYLRYAAAGFWISYLGPRAFVALHLASRLSTPQVSG